MTNKTDGTNVQELFDSKERESRPTEATDLGKKKFVEPELSVPVSVLEATTFFQGTTTGGTS